MLRVQRTAVNELALCVALACSALHLPTDALAQTAFHACEESPTGSYNGDFQGTTHGEFSTPCTEDSEGLRMEICFEGPFAQTFHGEETMCAVLCAFEPSLGVAELQDRFFIGNGLDLELFIAFTDLRFDIESCSVSGKWQIYRNGTFPDDNDPEKPLVGKRGTWVLGPGSDCKEVTWLTESGSLNDPDKWAFDDLSFDGTVPTETDVVTFSFVSGTVSMAEDTTHDRMEILGDTMALDLGGKEYTLIGECDEVGSSLRIGMSSGGGGGLLLKNGSLVARNDIDIAGLGGASGSLTAAESAIVSAPTLSLGNGGLPTSSLSVIDGGQVEVDTLAVNAGVAITGEGSRLSNTRFGQIGIDQESIVEVSDGATAEFAELRVGAFSGGQGDVTVIEASSMDVNGLLTVGHQGGDTEVAEGAITVSDGSGLVTGSVTSIAAQPFTIGKMTIKGEGTTWQTADTINIGFAGDGALFIQDGATVSCPDAVLGNVAGGRGDVRIEGDSTWIVEGAVRVGLGGTGIISVDQNATLLADLVGLSSMGTIDTTRIYIGGNSAIFSAARTFGASMSEQMGIVTSALVVDEGAKLNVDEVVLDEGGILAGSGAFSFDVTNTGTLMPGGDAPRAGRLTVEGNYTQSNSAVLNIELGGPVAGDDYDILEIEGEAALDGTLAVSLIADYIPNVGNAYDVVMSRSVTGRFARIIEPPGVTLEAEYDNTGLTLRVTAAAIAPPGGRLCGAFGSPAILFVVMGLSAMKPTNSRRTKGFHSCQSQSTN